MDDVRYSARLVWSDEDDGYIATAPELEGVSAFGETLEDALSELVIARGVWIEEACESGRDLPAPLTLPSYPRAGPAAGASSSGLTPRARSLIIGPSGKSGIGRASASG